jgi:hypothetical protein
MIYIVLVLALSFLSIERHMLKDLIGKEASNLSLAGKDVNHLSWQTGCIPLVIDRADDKDVAEDRSSMPHGAHATEHTLRAESTLIITVHFVSVITELLARWDNSAHLTVKVGDDVLVPLELDSV